MAIRMKYFLAMLVFSLLWVSCQRAQKVKDDAAQQDTNQNSLFGSDSQTGSDSSIVADTIGAVSSETTDTDTTSEVQPTDSPDTQIIAVADSNVADSSVHEDTASDAQPTNQLDTLTDSENSPDTQTIADSSSDSWGAADSASESGGDSDSDSAGDSDSDSAGDSDSATEDACTVSNSGTEVCDGIDNDCNGAVDDGVDCSHVLKQVSAGDSFTCALFFDGSISCWGSNSDEQATPPAGVAFESIAAGGVRACGIRQADGGVQCWGREPASSPGGGPFKSISAGGNSVCGIRKSDGGVRCSTLYLSLPYIHDAEGC